MGLSSHLLSESVIGRYGNEMRLVETLVEQVPDNSVTLFDRGFWLLGLLHDGHSGGETGTGCCR